MMPMWIHQVWASKFPKGKVCKIQVPHDENKLAELWDEWEVPDRAGHLVEPAIIVAWSLFVHEKPPSYYTKFEDDGSPMHDTMVKFPFSYFLKGAESFVVNGLRFVTDGHLPEFRIQKVNYGYGRFGYQLDLPRVDHEITAAILAAAGCQRCIPLYEAANRAWHEHHKTRSTMT